MISGTFNFMIVFQAEHNILMHPFHMLGELNNASPSVQPGDCTFLGFWIPRNLVNDKRGIDTRLNGGSSKGFALCSSYPYHSSSTNVSLNFSSERFFCLDSGDSNDLTLNNPVPIRMSPRQLPGVYMVLCLANNKRYFGESKNVSSRISQHKSKLRRNIHEISELQRDFNLYGEENFEFSALYISRDCSLDERVAMEIEFIGRFYSLCYNKFDKTNHKKENNPFWGRTHTLSTRTQIGESSTRTQIGESLRENRKNSSLEGFAILLKGEVYPSISEASRQTSHSRDTIRRWLRDPNQTDCVPIDTSKPRSNIQSENSQDPLVVNTGFAKQISIYGITYSSIAEAARQRNCSRANIQHLLRNDPNDCFMI